MQNNITSCIKKRESFLCERAISRESFYVRGMEFLETNTPTNKTYLVSEISWYRISPCDFLSPCRCKQHVLCVLCLWVCDRALEVLVQEQSNSEQFRVKRMSFRTTIFDETILFWPNPSPGHEVSMAKACWDFCQEVATLRGKTIMLL